MAKGNPDPQATGNGKPWQFKKGEGSRNPGGRPKQVLALLKYARKKTKTGLATMAKIAEDETTTYDEPSDRVAFLRIRIDCIKFLATYGMGRPPTYDSSAVAPEAPAKAPLSDEEQRNLARLTLAEEPDDEDDDEVDSSPH